VRENGRFLDPLKFPGVRDLIFGDFPAKNTVYAAFIHMVPANPIFVNAGGGGQGSGCVLRSKATQLPLLTGFRLPQISGPSPSPLR